MDRRRALHPSAIRISPLTVEKVDRIREQRDGPDGPCDEELNPEIAKVQQRDEFDRLVEGGGCGSLMIHCSLAASSMGD